MLPNQKFVPNLGNRPRYYHYHVPAINALIASNMDSPIAVYKRYCRQKRITIPSNQELADHIFPPIARWSDLAWTAYSEHAARTPGLDPKKLQYIGHDNVINSDAGTVIDYIKDKYGGAKKPVPGYEFDIDTDDGKALLGTANGMGTGWLMHDRARDLGRRGLKIRIWWSGPFGGGHINMALNMVPLEPSTSSSPVVSTSTVR